MEPARAVGRPRTSPASENYYDADVVAARRAYMTRYKAENAERLKAYYRAWRTANPEKHREYNRAGSARDRFRRQQSCQGPQGGHRANANQLPEGGPTVDPGATPPSSDPVSQD